MLLDSWGRLITYLRISVTDRCNLRCIYCMPPEGVPWKSHEHILRYEEIAAVVKVAAEQGIKKVRLTGGEPLVRLDLPDLVQMLAAIPGIEEISLTTNGLLLERMARPLAEAGLKRVNISLDTLQPDKFARITRGGSLEQVWRGIVAAEACGLTPIKLNVVALRGINDDELLDLARLTFSHPWHVRFIELMPIMNQAPWGPDWPDPAEAYLSIDEIRQILKPLELVMADNLAANGPARLYRARGALGMIGFISPIGEHFCESCNRLRLTADGHLRPCLLSDIEVDVRAVLRSGQPVLLALQQAVAAKPASHGLMRHVLPNGRCMRQIGG